MRDEKRRVFSGRCLSWLPISFAGLLGSAPAYAITCAQISSQITNLDKQKNEDGGCSSTSSKHTISVPGQIVTSVCTPDKQAVAAFMASHKAEYDNLDAQLAANGCTPSCPNLPKASDPNDIDGDGIPDAVEDTLIGRFSPYLRFTIPPVGYRDDGYDPYRPMDPLTFVKNAKLVDKDDSSTVYVKQSDLANNPLLVLTSKGYGGAPSNILDAYLSNKCIQGSAGAQRYALEGVNEGIEKGSDWGTVMANANVGLFAHVSRFRPGSASDLPSLDPVRRYINGSSNPVIPLSRYQDPAYAHNCNIPTEICYKIEYYQFFGKNDDFQAGIGNHEADLSVITMIYSQTLDQLVAVSHWAHGYEMRFDLLSDSNNPKYPGCARTDDSVVGNQIQCFGANNGASGINLLNIRQRFEGAKLTSYAKQDVPERAQNNAIYFAIDPNSNKYTHPVVFIEAGSHEFWPTSRWSASGAPAHNGDDTQHHYLSVNIPNLGEIEYPRSEEARIFIQYNGYWGNRNEYNDNSPGPSLHSSWYWFTPQRPPIQPNLSER